MRKILLLFFVLSSIMSKTYFIIGSVNPEIEQLLLRKLIEINIDFDIKKILFTICNRNFSDFETTTDTIKIKKFFSTKKSCSLKWKNEIEEFLMNFFSGEIKFSDHGELMFLSNDSNEFLVLLQKLFEN